MAESKKKKAAKGSKRASTARTKKTETNKTTDTVVNNQVEADEVIEASATTSSVTPSTATSQSEYGITHRTASGPSEEKITSKLSKVTAPVLETASRRSFWAWVGGTVVVIFLLLVVWWQWQRSYVAIINNQYVPTTALIERALIDANLEGMQPLARLTEQYLIYQEAENLGIELDEETIQTQLDEFIAESGGPDQYQEQLQRLNITEEYVINQLKTHQIMVKLVEDKINITDEDVRRHYDDNIEAIDPEGTRGFENIKDLVRTELTEQRQNAEFGAAYQSLQEKATIVDRTSHINLTFGQFLKNEILSIPDDIAHLYRSLTGQE